MRPYLIWSFDYAHASAGPKALHRLCHELNEAGREAYVSHPVTRADWRTPYLPGTPFGDDWIAVYPEVISGNPWNAPHVARWVLNVPGKLGGDTEYDPSEMVFSWHRDYMEDVPRLYLPAIETDIYVDHGEEREGEIFYVGKGSLLGWVNGASPITRAMREDRYALAAALNRATLLRSFDPVSAMNSIALLCGCPVLIEPTGEFLGPYGFRERFLAECAEFPAQLARFIEITQA